MLSGLGQADDGVGQRVDCRWTAKFETRASLRRLRESNRCRSSGGALGGTRLPAIVRVDDAKKALAYLPAIPAVRAFAPRAWRTCRPFHGASESSLSCRNPPLLLRFPGHITDPEELVSSALAILAGHKPAPAPALELPLPQLPPLRADTTPANIGRQSAPSALPLQQRSLSDGSSCPLPIRYFDAQLLIATYLVDYGRASALLKDTGLIAVPQGVGQAIAAFGCFQYRKTDIGPYNEVGLTVLAAAPKSPVPALYVAAPSGRYRFGEPRRP